MIYHNQLSWAIKPLWGEDNLQNSHGSLCAGSSVQGDGVMSKACCLPFPKLQLGGWECA